MKNECRHVKPKDGETSSVVRWEKSDSPYMQHEHHQYRDNRRWVERGAEYRYLSDDTDRQERHGNKGKGMLDRRQYKM